MRVKLTRTAAVMVAAAGGNLRIEIRGGGCQGYSYAFSPAPPLPDDAISAAGEGATVSSDIMSATLIDGSTVDYADSLNGKGFTIVNPNAVSSCGCGVSFAA